MQTLTLVVGGVDGASDDDQGIVGNHPCFNAELATDAGQSHAHRVGDVDDLGGAGTAVSTAHAEHPVSDGLAGVEAIGAVLALEDDLVVRHIHACDLENTEVLIVFSPIKTPISA